MGDANKTIFDAYIKALGDVKAENNEDNIGKLQTAADALSGILDQNAEENNDIKADIERIKVIDPKTIDLSVIKELKSDINYNSLKIKVDAAADDAAAESTGITVKNLDKSKINDLKLFDNTTAYKAITPNGEYIVFKGAVGEFDTLTGGKKSRKSKTHKQKKVHRSTQKRNGRKKTSHRRK